MTILAYLFGLGVLLWCSFQLYEIICDMIYLLKKKYWD